MINYKWSWVLSVEVQGIMGRCNWETLPGRVKKGFLESRCLYYIRLEYIKLAMKGGAGMERSVVIKAKGIGPSLQKCLKTRDKMALGKDGQLLSTQTSFF